MPNSINPKATDGSVIPISQTALLLNARFKAAPRAKPKSLAPVAQLLTLAFSLHLFVGFHHVLDAALEVEALLRHLIQFASENHVEGFDALF